MAIPGGLTGGGRNMNEQTIHKKIQDTLLFSDDQKSVLLLLIAQASEEDKRKLIEGIDVFDRAYKDAVAKHSLGILSAVDEMEAELTPQEKTKNQAALDTIRLGVGLLSS